MQCPRCSSAIPQGATACPECGTPASPVVSRPLPSGEAADSCPVCGHPLGGKEVCDMCGSPAGMEKKVAQRLRCPICGRDLGDSLNCPQCGSIVGRKEEGEEPGFRCPGCEHLVALKDERCASCGLLIWLDESSEGARLDSLRCPACASLLGENDETCGRCGFLVWMESEEDRLERARKAIEDAALQIADFRQKFGEPPEKAETYLDAANRVMQSGEAELAWRRALVASEVAETTARQIAILQEAWRRAEEWMRAAEESGGDVTKCREMLDLSRQANQEGDRKVALRFALKSKILAEEIVASLRRAPFGG